VLAYKFLAPGTVGVFSGFTWPRPAGARPGAWVQARGALETCGNGVHACRPADLPFWLAEELWRVELGGEVLEVERGLVARRGRLLERIDSWTPEAARELAEVCRARSGALAEQALAASGIVEDADVAGYARDTASYAAQASEGDVAWASCTAYVGAFTAGLAASGSARGARRDPAYFSERRWQAEWLAGRLGLPEADTTA
jgi:hypothetical protein